MSSNDDQRDEDFDLLVKVSQPEQSITQSEYTAVTGEKQHGEGSMSISSGIFNLVNTIIGSGFLTLPYNIMLNGWVGGTLQMTVIAFLTAVSCFQLIDVSTNIHTYQYYAIARKLFNSKAIGILISLVMIVQTGGSLISYSIIIQQNFYWWNKQDHMLYIQLAFWGFMLVLVFPLASLKNLAFLHWTSYITIFVVIYITIVTIIFFFTNDLETEKPVVYQINIQSLTTLPLFQGAFCCHYQIANIYRDLKHKTPAKMRKVVVYNMLIVFSLYATVALFGYFTFTSKFTQKGCSNLLKMFSSVVFGKWYIDAANILMLACMVAHYPLPCFGLRRTVESLIWGDNDAPNVWRIVVCLSLIIIAGLIGSFVDEIHLVLDYTSSLAGSCVVFIFPALFSIKVNTMNKSTLRLVFAIVTLVTGVFVMVTGLASSIYMQVTKEHE